MELRLAILLSEFKGDWDILQGFRQLSFELLTRGSELSFWFHNFDLVFELVEIIENVELTEDCLENCPRHDKAATSKAEAVDLSEVLADVSTYITAPDCLEIASSSWDDTQACACE